MTSSRLQSVDPRAQAGADQDQVGQGFRVGDRLPVALSREQLAAVIAVSVRRLDILRTLRSHPAIKELLPRVGHPRFSGVAAQAWLDQQLEPQPKFFKSARRHVSNRRLSTAARDRREIRLDTPPIVGDRS